MQFYWRRCFHPKKSVLENVKHYILQIYYHFKALWLQPQEEKLILENISFYQEKSNIEISSNTWHAVLFSSSYRYVTDWRSYFKKQKSLFGRSICLYFETRPIYLVITANVHKMTCVLKKQNKLLYETAACFKSLSHSVLLPGIMIREQNTHFFNRIHW